MGRTRAVGPLALVLIASVRATAGVAQAPSGSVQPPAETVHVTYHRSVEEPDTREEFECFPVLGCLALDPVYVDDPGAVDAAAGLRVEDNGCEGRGPSSGDCDGDDADEDGAREVVHAKEGASFCTVHPFC